MPTRLAWLVLLFVSLVVANPGEAHAHDAGLSRGEYFVTGNVVTMTLTFARRDLAHATHGEALDLALLSATFGGASVRGDEAVCPAALAEAAPFESDAIRLTVRATCSTRPRTVTIDATWLAALPFGHRHLAHAEGLAADAPLTISKRTFSFAVTAAPEPASAPRSFFFTLGVRHILSGLDHLLFLVALLLVGGTARELVRTVTAFTVGHSISLALATLGVFAPSPRIVEPLIALSIVYVGAENLFAPSPSKRWRITSAFGLIHGFGFAGALRELALPRAELPWALGLFNLGVESGQLAVLAVLVPLVTFARRRPIFAARVVPAVSVGIAAAGLAWFVLRLATP